MSHNDSAFFKIFSIVIGALVLFTLFCIVMANMLSPDMDYSNDPVVNGELQQRIGPVGQSRVADSPDSPAAKSGPADAPAAVAPVTAVAATVTGAVAVVAVAGEDEASAVAAIEPEPEPVQIQPDALALAKSALSSKQDIALNVRAVVATNCVGCHQAGVGGAQRMDDPVSWNLLASKGIDALTKSVIDGKGNMPPRAESHLNDDELREAVKYMLYSVGTDVIDTEAAATQQSDANAAVTTAGEATASTEPAKAELASAQIPENVKVTVDTICAACHASGVANAPKYGDKQAWADRAEAGVDALTASAIVGKGAMPPRGSSTLDDAQMKMAIEYILSK